MSYFKTKRAMTTHLLANLPTGLTGDDLAFENHKFVPANKPLWLAAYFIPVSTESVGKTDASSDENRGIFQVSVFVKLNSDQFDEVQLKAIDELIIAFRYNTQATFDSQTVQILESTVNNGSESESWYQRDISIGYLTFSTR